MKHLYFVSNNLISSINIINQNSKLSHKEKMLSRKGEENARKLTTLKPLEKIEVIYASSYLSALETAKFIAEEKKLDIQVDNRLNERIEGDLGCNEPCFLKGMQEHNFNYKLPNGESIHEVMQRMNNFFEDILKSKDNNILIITHSLALLSLALKWCNTGFNLEDNLILDYQDEVIFDDANHELDLIEVTYNDKKFNNIKRLI